MAQKKIKKQITLRDKIGYKIGTTAAMLRFFVNSSLKTHGLTVEEVVLLECVKEKNGKAIKEIAEILPKQRGNLTKIMDLLAEKRLISRKNSKEDRRTITIEITARGSNKLKQGTKAIEKSLNQATKSIAQNDMRKLILILEKIQGNIANE